MSRRTETQEEEAGAIDLTPMLDVVFIMLIFFIVTASFIKEPGVEVNRPEANTAESKKNASILVAINSSNEIWIDKQMVDPRQVRPTIERLHAENPKGGIVVQADDEANVEAMAQIVEAARELGILDVSVATEKN
ncbi:ExbD/TolR family protein [Marinibactrum halimedae]|uniref:Biopolymer transporter ExbD n=1 Tax=Marinibactrum halimedae TaxID=1444977 RepID=A0AA37T1L5_9GAMM|nr:biopolymer transporter ExbD [Marinibactrum halimedae]MCD9458776.1 biopolymer transporter ExbD [Marinibactrum halimedae]GLS25335.1 biopolymer transporter ExbD [Marinibactrum halimedae]